MENTKLYIETPVFTGRNVPINELAKAIGKMPNTFESVFNKVF